jgi:hypothetical protein
MKASLFVMEEWNGLDWIEVIYDHLDLKLGDNLIQEVVTRRTCLVTQVVQLHHSTIVVGKTELTLVKLRRK